MAVRRGQGEVDRKNLDTLFLSWYSMLLFLAVPYAAEPGYSCDEMPAKLRTRAERPDLCTPPVCGGCIDAPKPEGPTW